MMIKRNYYYLVAGLPDIIPDDKKLPFSSAELRQLLEENLHPSDAELVKLIYLPFDHKNLLDLLFNNEAEWDERGNYPEDELEKFTDKKHIEVVEINGFPDYFINFIKEYYEGERDFSIAEAEMYLTKKWYDLLLSSKNQFVKDMALYKKNMSNIMLALNGRKYDIPYEDALIGDDEITYALKRSRARDFGLSYEVEGMENLVQIFETDNILDREMRLDMHFWEFLDERTFFDYFTIERILAFVQKMFIAERWYSLDAEKGIKIFNQLLETLKSNFEFPEEFAITYGKRR